MIWFWIVVTHGEPAAADEMRRRIKETFGWEESVTDTAAVTHVAVNNQQYTTIGQ